MNLVKGNKEFWLYIVGIIVLIILLLIGGFYVLSGREIFPSKVENIPTTFDKPPEYNIDTRYDYFALFKTNKGEFKADLYEVGAPVNVNNFVFLAKLGYYDYLTFYRLVENLLIQSGSRATLNDDPTDDNFGNPGYTVKDEINWDSLDLSSEKRAQLLQEGYKSDPDVASRKIKKYSLVMANANAPNTAGSQYFIVIGDDADPRLNYLIGRHTVIGEIIEGTDILDQIRNINAKIDDAEPQISRPIEDIIVESITIITQSK